MISSSDDALPYKAIPFIFNEKEKQLGIQKKKEQEAMTKYGKWELIVGVWESKRTESAQKKWLLMSRYTVYTFS